MRLSKKYFVALIISLLALFLIMKRPRHPDTLNVAAAAASSEWGMNPTWDDGLAEVAKYQARRTVYGKTRVFETICITVKEDFTPNFYVKADSPSDQSIPVLKFNVVSTIPAGNYDYRYLTSVFVSRHNPMNLIKLTSGSQEWCGNTFKEVRNWENKSGLIFHSYFDGEGDGSLTLDLRPGDLMEDQLPVALRSLAFKEGHQFRTRVLDSLIDNRAKPPRLSSAEIAVRGREKLNDWNVWRVEVRREGLLQTYWFEQAFPNILVKCVSSDGRELLLKERTRWKYW